MDGSKQPILPPTSQKLGKFHPLKEDSDKASLFSDTDDEHKIKEEQHLKELYKLNMDGSPNSTKKILKKLPPQQQDEEKKQEEIVESDDESLFGSSSSLDEVFGQESTHYQHDAKVMDKRKLHVKDLPLTGATPSRGKEVASLQRRGVTQPSSEVKKQKIPIFNPPTLKGGEAEDDNASSDDGSVYSEGDSKKKKKKKKPTSNQKSGGLLGGLLSKVESKDKAQSKLYREDAKKIKYRDTTIKDLTPDRRSEKEKKLQKFLMKHQEADAMSGKTNVELYSTPSSSTTKAVPNTFTASTSTKKKKSTSTNNNDWQYSSQETKWNKNYNIIQQYISKHGNSNIPEGHSLHKWVQSQRNLCLRWIAGVNKNEELIGNHLQKYVHVYKLHAINFDWGDTVDRRVLHDVLAVVDMNLSPAQRETLFPKKMTIKKKMPKQNVGLKKRKGSIKKSGSVFDAISSKRKQERDDTRQGKKLARNVTDHNSSDDDGGSVKKRPPRDEDIIEFTDDVDSQSSISWNDHTKKPKKRRKAALNNMPANQWVRLLMTTKERYTKSSKAPPSSSASKTSSSNKCWSNLVKAGEDEESIDLASLVRSKIVEEQLQNSIKEAAAKASSEEMMTISELKKSKEVSKEAVSSPEKSITSASQEPIRVLKNGKKVYAPFWKTSARSGQPSFYPGVVASSKVVLKGGESTVLYNIDYDDGDKGTDIDGSLVKTRKTYLRKNLKPFLMAGDEVYAAWWEDEKRDKAATWHPGVIKSVVEFSYGGEYGPIRKYDVAFDDGDELDSIEDYFVMNKKDYLISISKEDREWMGVENRLEKSSIDNWEKYAGLWVSTIDGEEQLFGQLSGKLSMCDHDRIVSTMNETHTSSFFHL